MRPGRSASLVLSVLPALLALVGAIAWAQPPAAAPAEGTPAAEGTPVADVAAPEATAAAPARRRRERSRSRSRGRSRGSERTTKAATGSDATSVSVGRHNRGRLLHGAELTAEGHLRLKHPTGDQHHGTDELVTLLRSASESVWTGSPGTPLTVGDLSRHSGGRFRPHRSHQNGRDVDVGFYIQDLEGNPVAADRFVDFGPMGTTRHDATWRFDDTRNWLFVEYMLSQTDAPVQYMFVSRELRRRLLAEGARRAADPEILARAARVLYQPPAGGRHRDHFHVRVYCDSGDMPRCRDDGPRHPWLRGLSAIADATSRGMSGLEDVLSATAWFTAPPEATAPEGDPEEADEAPARSRSRARSRRSRSRSRRSRRH